MQLTNSKPKEANHSKPKAANVRLALAAATTSLLSLSAQAEQPWKADTALSVYSEADSRVQAVEPIVALSKDLGEGQLLSLKLTLDSLTGASPNGALASNQVQTFTGPSGRESYQAKAGETPLDTSFHDTRSAISASWTQPLGERNQITLGGNFSKEYDFTSAGLNAAIARDFNQKNTTLSLGLNLESDQVDAVGGVPRAFSALDTSITGGREGEGDEASGGGNGKSKTVSELLLGISQVMNRHWLTQINFAYGSSSGYQNDPYKILSVLADDGANLVNPETGQGNWYAYENRPDSRTRSSIYWGNKIHLREDVIDFSYRYYTDDWGIKSNTLDVRYRYQWDEHFYIEPHLRWYSQTAADFYQPYLSASQDTAQGAVTLDYASADPRLAKLSGTTFGVKVGYSLDRDTELSVRLESYQQKGDVQLPASMTQLQGIDPYPDLKAMTLLIGYSFSF